MLAVLLLQTNPTANANPYVAYFTLAAALIAAGASFYSTTTASKTAREAARLSAQTARELKEEDYKKDFYKKILDRRLSAWTEAEQLFLPLRAAALTGPDGKDRFGFFYEPQEFRNLFDTLNKCLISQIFWLGGGYNNELLLFRNRLSEIHDKCITNEIKDGVNVIDAAKLFKAGAVHYEELHSIYLNVLAELSAIIGDLHNIEGFLQRRKESSPMQVPTMD
jgi:hypothetical protein